MIPGRKPRLDAARMRTMARTIVVMGSVWCCWWLMPPVTAWSAGAQPAPTYADVA
jgi:hypothetical protein